MYRNIVFLAILLLFDIMTNFPYTSLGGIFLVTDGCIVHNLLVVEVLLTDLSLLYLNLERLFPFKLLIQLD